MKNLFIAIGLLFCASTSFAQIYKDPSASVEARVEDVLSRLTNEEKIDYIGGKDQLNIRAIARLGIPQIRMSDASVGIKNYGNGTAYPASILGAATWDVDLSSKYGMAIGSDARSRGVHILLGPGVNIYRAPMCGRNFEYLGEDPFLSGQMVVAYIQGLQSKGVVAPVKHFAANNSEWNRQNVSSDMDERTLQEIYLPAFKAAVQQGKVGAVMCSYNLINGVHATQKVEPMFLFGFGLSYTSFAYSNLIISGDAKSANRTVSFDVTNTGTRDGSEAAQVYVHQIACNVPRPLKELKGFAKVALKQGETKTLSLVLDSAAFSYYKTSQNGFGMDMGEFEILVGSSSRDIRLKGSVVQSKYDTSLPIDTAYFPTKNAQNVTLNTVFNISFNNTVFYTSGKNIQLKNSADNSIVETIAESNILGMGTNVLTFKTKNNLALGIQYYIEIDSAAIIDFSNNAFAGIKGADKWTFKAITTGIEDNKNDQDVQVFPIPAKDVLNFKLGSIANHKVDFFDLNGRVVYSFATNNMHYTYSCSGKKKGIYICRILNDKETILKKVKIE